MATYSEMYSEILGIVPGVSVFQAQKWINRAWTDILRRRTWSFLVAEGAFNAPSLIQAGSVSVTQNSQAVVADVTAAAALDAVALGIPPLTSRQFRVGSLGGEIYNLTAWDSPTRTLTLERPFLQGTNAAATYSVYQCYVPPPPQAVQTNGLYDFDRWISVLDPINGFALKSDQSKAWLDLRDPQRSDAGLAYFIFDYKAKTDGTPLYEFWPHPTSGQTYNVIYRRKGQAFINGDSLPAMIPDALVLDRALYKYAYPWAAVNSSRNPALKGPNWGFQQQEAARQWEADLQRAKLEDENVFMQAIVGPLRSRGYGPIDAKFMQSHDMSAFMR